jgi:polynucleotide 5'-kinase involved in rRNA processing
MSENTKSKYSGFETREIKSISEVDMNILRKGRGGAFGGMALLAELNHHPGPIHVIELEKELNLTKEQKQKTQQIYDEMEKDAKRLGEELISIEKKMDEGFARETITESELRELLLKSAEIYGLLRFTHLRCHLTTKKLLTKGQVRQYDILRGYSHS